MLTEEGGLMREPRVCTNARMFVLYVCACLCVDDEAAPAGLGFGKGDECKNQEEGAKSDGIGRWAIFVESRDGRRKDRCQRNGRWTRWIFFGFDFFFGAKRGREEEEEEEGGRERDAIKGVSQPVPRSG